MNTEKPDNDDAEKGQFAPKTEPQTPGTATAGGNLAIKPETQELYAQIIQLLVIHSNAKRVAGTNEEFISVSASDMAKDLIERTDLKPTSHKTYVFALKHHLQKNPNSPSTAEAIKILNAWLAGKRKSAPKKEATAVMSQKDYLALLEDLVERSGTGSAWARRTQHWLVATMATGIRPREWLTAEWVDGEKTAIRVTNGKIKLAPPGFMRNKQTESESKLPRTREIPVVNPSDRISIDSHLQDLHAYIAQSRGDEKSLRKAYDLYRNNVTRKLWRSCDALWEGKKIYSLYSARRQFSADKRADIGVAATSTMMGHSRPDTPSSSFYGKANQARSRTGVNYRNKQAATDSHSDTPQAPPTPTPPSSAGEAPTTGTPDSA